MKARILTTIIAILLVIGSCAAACDEKDIKDGVSGNYTPRITVIIE